MYKKNLKLSIIIFALIVLFIIFSNIFFKYTTKNKYEKSILSSATENIIENNIIENVVNEDIILENTTTNEIIELPKIENTELEVQKEQLKEKPIIEEQQQEKKEIVKENKTNTVSTNKSNTTSQKNIIQESANTNNEVKKINTPEKIQSQEKENSTNTTPKTDSDSENKASLEVIEKANIVNETKKEEKQTTSATETKEKTEEKKEEKVISIYEYPFNIDAIKKEMILLGESIGLKHISEDSRGKITPSNSSWSDFVTATQNIQGKKLERTLKDYVSYAPKFVLDYGGQKLETFTIYTESIGNGNYNFYFLY